MPGVPETPANDQPQDWQFAVRIALIGVGSGVALWLLTTLLSRSTISGNGWSLAGNGALIIPFGLGPADLVHRRHRPASRHPDRRLRSRHNPPTDMSPGKVIEICQ